MSAQSGRLPLIAIDGPAGSGKSTVARAVAERLSLDHLDTGAMYRSVAYLALRSGVDPEDDEAVVGLAREAKIHLAERVMVNGMDATKEIRTNEVTRAVTPVSANPRVRQEMVRRQREWAANRGGGVVEGRDIGTVVFPDADLKVYLVAGEEERARRRSLESEDSDRQSVAADLARRDQHDSSRSASPLSPADDAVVLDTTGRSVDDVVEEVLRHL